MLFEEEDDDDDENDGLVPHGRSSAISNEVPSRRRLKELLANPYINLLQSADLCDIDILQWRFITTEFLLPLSSPADIQMILACRQMFRSAQQK